MSIIRMSRIVTPLMLVKGGGSIVNIFGADAYEPDLRFAVASTFRSAIGAYQKLYATRYVAHGIRMNSVLPGVTMDFDPNHVRDDLRSIIPMRRPASYSEIAFDRSFDRCMIKR
jgi:NAD(P)-dependent dehydrogenase (short-subunit alcohol dehydrogenase family)